MEATVTVCLLYVFQRPERELLSEPRRRRLPMVLHHWPQSSHDVLHQHPSVWRPEHAGWWWWENGCTHLNEMFEKNGETRRCFFLSLTYKGIFSKNVDGSCSEQQQDSSLISSSHSDSTSYIIERGRGDVVIVNLCCIVSPLYCLLANLLLLFSPQEEGGVQIYSLFSCPKLYV